MPDHAHRRATARNPLALIILGGGFAGFMLASFALASGLGLLAALLAYGLGGSAALVALAAAAPEPAAVRRDARHGRAHA